MMSNFWARTITGLSMVFLMVAAMAFSYWMFAGFLLLVVLLGLWEFYSLFTSGGMRPQRWAGMTGGVVMYIAIVLTTGPDFPASSFSPGFIPVLSAIPVLFLPFVLEIFRNRPHPLVNIAITITGIIYIPIPLAVMTGMNGPHVLRFWQLPVLLTGFLILTWFYDTGAYLIGRQFGKHKFFERISPKKTWEGTAGGIAVALLTATGIHLLIPSIALVDWLAMAGLIILFGTSGDLVESLFKRSLQIKDSGNILPGHGGILDRFDTIFISVPFVFLYLVLRNLI